MNRIKQYEQRLTRQKIDAAAAATSKVLLEMNKGICNNASWIQWCFRLEALPTFDRSLIARVRSLTSWALNESSPNSTSPKDVWQCYRKILRQLQD